MSFCPHEMQFRNWGELDQHERSGVQGSKVRWGDFLARGTSPSYFTPPTSSKMPDSHQTDKRNFWRAV